MSTVLTSWKEIATYLGKSVRTVQRWEGELGLPVRRPNLGDRNIVAALPGELDEWVQKRLTARNKPVPTHATQIERMHKLVQSLQEQTGRTHARTLELVKQLEASRQARTERSDALKQRPPRRSEIN